MSVDATSKFETQVITWQLDGTTMEGTMALPEGPGPHPGVVLVAGSGPTDRDWNSPLIPGANGSGRLLAEALARAGFATLRYDKRVVGPHARENLTQLVGKISLQSHLHELAAAVERLAAQPGVDRARIFALTNSEGALHGLNYQVHEPATPFAGLVLTAPPGRAVGAVGRTQIVAQLTPVAGGDRLIELYDEAMGRFTAGQEIDPDPALPEGVQMLLRSLVTPMNLPFARELWFTDPTTWLAQVSAPVLVLIGKKDIQVDWQTDGSALERAAAGRPNFTFVYPPDANHVLKHEDTPRPELTAAIAMVGYNSPERGLDDESLAAILSALKSWR